MKLAKTKKESWMAVLRLARQDAVVCVGSSDDTILRVSSLGSASSEDCRGRMELVSIRPRSHVCACTTRLFQCVCCRSSF